MRIKKFVVDVPYFIVQTICLDTFEQIQNVLVFFNVMALIFMIMWIPFLKRHTDLYESKITEHKTY